MTLHVVEDLDVGHKGFIMNSANQVMRGGGGGGGGADLTSMDIVAARASSVSQTHLVLTL